MNLFPITNTHKADGQTSADKSTKIKQAREGIALFLLAIRNLMQHG